MENMEAAAVVGLLEEEAAALPRPSMASNSSALVGTAEIGD